MLMATTRLKVMVTAIPLVMVMQMVTVLVKKAETPSVAV